MKNDRKKYITREKNNHTKNAKKERIENVETTKVDPKDITLSVPFQIASKLNQDVNLRRSQNNLRKQLYTYIEDDFKRFTKDMSALDAYPAIRVRLFIEIMKMVLPRPKEYDDGADSQEQRSKIISRLFGKELTQ